VLGLSSNGSVLTFGRGTEGQLTLPADKLAGKQVVGVGGQPAPSLSRPAGNMDAPR
jgi:hypothetical protein